MESTKGQLLMFGVVVVIVLTAAWMFTGQRPPAPIIKNPDTSGLEETDSTDWNREDELEEIPEYPNNPDASALRERIRELRAKEWDKQAYGNLRFDLDNAFGSKLIDEKIHEDLGNHLSIAYLRTVKNTARKVLAESTSIADLHDVHAELKILDKELTDDKAKVVLNITGQVYGLTAAVAKMNRKVQDIETPDGELVALGNEISGYPTRAALRESRLVKTISRNGIRDLQEKWGEMKIRQFGDRVKNYCERSAFEEVRTEAYKAELNHIKEVEYLSGNDFVIQWVEGQKSYLTAHADKAVEFMMMANSKGGVDCSVYNGFYYYLEKCEEINDTTSVISN